MNKILCGLFALSLCFFFAESLSCNKCKVGLFGKCFVTTTTTCSNTTLNCYSAKVAFTNFPNVLGFSSMGCLDSASCNMTTNGTILFIGYNTTTTCCNTDNCSPVTLDGAASIQFSVTAAVSTALVATVWSSWMH